MKRKIIIMSVVVVTFIAFILSANADSQISTPVDVEYEKYLERNWKMVELSTKLQKRLMDYYHIEKQFEDKYPEYYGGIYISDDAKSLVLQIVKDNIPKKETEDYKIYEELTTMDDAIEIEYVDNTFNELNEVNNVIGEYVNANESINSTYINMVDNSVTVGVSENTEINRKTIKNHLAKKRLVIDSNIINYTQEDAEIPYADINAGGKIYLTRDYNDKFACSMGFRTRLYGMDGYVTAGHCVSDYPTPPSAISTMYLQFTNNEYYDYAFVATNSSYTPTNKLAQFIPGINNTLGVYNYCINVTVNMTISKIGFKTGLSSGKVTGLNKTVRYGLKDGSTVVIKGLVGSNLVGNTGDSGGIVFVPNIIEPSSPIGIVNAGNNGNPGMSFTNINNMLSDLQTGRY